MHLVRVSLLIIWAVLFLCCAATTTGIHAAQRSNADIEKAFELDGLQVSQWVSFEGLRATPHSMVNARNDNGSLHPSVSPLAPLTLSTLTLQSQLLTAYHSILCPHRGWRSVRFLYGLVAGTGKSFVCSRSFGLVLLSTLLCCGYDAIPSYVHVPVHMFLTWFGLHSYP